MSEKSEHARPSGAERDVEHAIRESEPAVEDMERRSEALDDEIRRVERDWESKQQDARVPGAQEEIEDVETERQDLGEEPGGGDR